MSRTRITIALAFAAAALVMTLFAAPLASAANRPSTPSGPTKHEVRALMVRGLALNRLYHVGAYAGPSTQEVRALRLRGMALNRIYHLGAYAGPSTQEVRALRLRGMALNRIYHLGPYATATGSSFPWGKVEIGIATAFGAILVAGWAAVGVRRRRTAIAT
jgi:hypothetical protein